MPDRTHGAHRELVEQDLSIYDGRRIPGWDGGAYAHMRRVLETDVGGGLYRKPKAMIEPVFANTKFNRRIDASNAEEDRPHAPNGG